MQLANTGRAPSLAALMLSLSAILLSASPAHAQPAAAPAVPPAVPPVAPEDWAVHFQSTGTWFFQPGFTSPYQGPQSLSPAANGRETFDATLFLGVRPWQGGELWFNPEIDQGFGLADTFGAAGFVSGEAYKVGAQDPYFLVQRLFLRQTFDLAGDVQTIDPAINQLGGSQTANRVIVTLGKISVPDIFDNNAYAHDSKNDVLNWANLDGGAFDYAANAWGYTYGGAVEWYQDWWALRGGAFNLSNIPNSKNIDPRVLAQYQAITEAEARYDLAGQPGKLRVLYWISRGRLGTYDDAIALAEATGTTPSTALVRRYRSKDGAALSWEQQIMPNFGIFLRASASQGSVEADEFTDINKSLALGTQLNGALWGRPDDEIVTSFIADSISHAGKLYLEDGGLGILVGDGRLPHAGPEQICETYYALPIYKYTHVTLDYQFINNPGYNSQRGPVSVFALRLHIQL